MVNEVFKRYDKRTILWIPLTYVIRDMINEGAPDEEIMEVTEVSKGRLDWAKTFLSSQNLKDAVDSWEGDKTVKEAIRVFFPEWYSEGELEKCLKK